MMKVDLAHKLIVAGRGRDGIWFWCPSAPGISVDLIVPWDGGEFCEANKDKLKPNVIDSTGSPWGRICVRIRLW